MSQLVYRGRRDDRDSRFPQTNVNIFMPGMGPGLEGGWGKGPETVGRKDAATGILEESKEMGVKPSEEYDFFSEPQGDMEEFSDSEEPRTPMNWRVSQGLRRAGEAIGGFFGDLRDRWNAWRARPAAADEEAQAPLLGRGSAREAESETSEEGSDDIRRLLSEVPDEETSEESGSNPGSNPRRRR
jgi:hypothetical protein